MPYATTLTVRDLGIHGLEAVALPGGTINRARNKAPLGIVTHTPGEPFAQQAFERAKRRLGREPTVEEYEDEAARSFDALNYQPGYLLGLTRVFQLDPDFKRTSHSGGLGMGCPEPHIYLGTRWRRWAKPWNNGGGWIQHGRDPDVVFDYWLAAFPGVRTPLDVYVWGASPNDAIGVDILPDPWNKYRFRAETQMPMLRHLTGLLSRCHGFKVSRETFGTHTLASPCERGTVLRNGVLIGTHWDPPANAWDHAAMLAEVAE